MSLLGIDFGDKRVGLAISHSEFLASEYKVLENQGLKDLVSEIGKICQEEGVEKIILGLPREANQNEGAQARKVRAFAQELEVLNLPIFLEDETLTSFEAEEILKDEGVKDENLKNRVNSLSAKLILQQYLEHTVLKKEEKS